MYVMVQAFWGDQPVYPAAVRAPLLGLCDGDMGRAVFALLEMADTGRANILLPSGLRFEARPLDRRGKV